MCFVNNCYYGVGYEFSWNYIVIMFYNRVEKHEMAAKIREFI